MYFKVFLFYFRPFEVSVNGKKQGITTKRLNTPYAALHTSRCNLLKTFIHTLESKPQIINKLNIDSETLKDKPYYFFKTLNNTYYNKWQNAKSDCLKKWSLKPKELQEFTYKDVFEAS